MSLDNETFKQMQYLSQLENATNFECEHCGYCCMNCEPIIIDQMDIIHIAEFLKKPVKVIKRKYIKQHPENPDGFAFKKTKPCHFYNMDSKMCMIYPVRPLICKAYPILTTEDFGLNIECNASVKVIERQRLQIIELNRILAMPEVIAFKKQVQENPALKQEILEYMENQKRIMEKKASEKLKQT